MPTLNLTDAQHLALALALADWLDIWSIAWDQPTYYDTISTVRASMAGQDAYRRAYRHYWATARAGDGQEQAAYDYAAAHAAEYAGQVSQEDAS